MKQLMKIFYDIQSMMDVFLLIQKKITFHQRRIEIMFAILRMEKKKKRAESKQKR